MTVGELNIILKNLPERLNIKIFVGEKDYREIFVNNLIRTPNELIIDVDEQTNSTIYDTQPIIFL